MVIVPESAVDGGGEVDAKTADWEDVVVVVAVVVWRILRWKVEKSSVSLSFLLRDEARSACGLDETEWTRLMRFRDLSGETDGLGGDWGGVDAVELDAGGDDDFGTWESLLARVFSLASRII